MTSSPSSPTAPARRGVRLAQLARLAACVLLLMAVAVRRDGRLFGMDVRSWWSGAESAAAVEAEADDQPSSEGIRIIDSTGLAPDIVGYEGPVPVLVRIGADNRVESVEPLPNEETPFVFRTLETEGFWQSWDGLPVEVAATTRVDAVTSATYSSLAAIENVRAALATVTAENAGLEDAEPALPEPSGPSFKEIFALAVLLAAALLPLDARFRRFRVVQQLLNVAVLGLWSGLFLSHGRLIGLASSGLPRDVWDSVAALLLLATALLFPLFGRSGHYCAHVCPFGSLQELAGRIPAPRLRLSAGLIRWLTLFRKLLWGVLILLLLADIGAGWTDWELFAAFAWRAAPPLLLALAGVTIVLSVFVPRPYCRFVCPTGTLLRLLNADS